MSNEKNSYSFVPFKGTHYEQGFDNGKKLLLLGESSFLHKGEKTEQYRADLELAKNYIWEDIRKEWITKTWPANTFIGRLHRLVTYKDDPTIEQIQEAWNKVAFTNHIPIFAGEGIDAESGEGAAAAKESKHWKLGPNAVKEAMEELQPDCILVLGKANWNHIKDGSWECQDWVSAGRSRGIWRIETGNSEPALATWVMHPSWGRDNVASMQNTLRDLLAYPSKPSQ